MIIIGLTGSIAMGKSTIAAMFENEGVPVHDADAAVHRLLAPDGSGFAPVTAAFEGIVGGDGRIDRQALGRAVFGNDDKRRQLEAILHPLVKQDRQAWLEEKEQRMLILPFSIFRCCLKQAGRKIVIRSLLSQHHRSNRSAVPWRAPG